MLDRLLYRAKQFWFAMSARMNEENRSFVHQYLNIKEAALFFSLPDYEQKHGVVVAKRMMREAADMKTIDKRKLVRLGLLHDIGKTAIRLTILSKSLLVIIHRAIPPLYELFAKLGKDEKSRKFFRRFYVHKHHGAIGADILKKINEQSDIINEVLSHDRPCTSHDMYMRLLDKVDSTY
ncbi:MAG: hypothetical protein FD145_1294 [Candidatus Saganbacteria bacterium]|uniref:HD domain-containing protein n=1 Tax=Candidatus Saganbacteria bacterium TaxID=2575572 RepID=A0A833NY55_UNCSA|nr:MAG: hypothetical protein FD145_1294 [Candidatus Saganbacteria bacterium]